PIGVSDTRTLERALLGTGFPYDRRQHADFYLAFLAEAMRRAQGVRRGGSAALDLCYVACGRLDAFWEWKLHPWDTAAGRLIVEEAGGRVTDFAGQPHRLAGQEPAASRPRGEMDITQASGAWGRGSIPLGGTRGRSLAVRRSRARKCLLSQHCLSRFERLDPSLPGRERLGGRRGDGTSQVPEMQQ